MSKLETIIITQEIKDKIVDWYKSRDWLFDASCIYKELPIDTKLTILDYSEAIRRLTWYTMPGVPKEIIRTIRSWPKYMIHFNHTKPGKQQERLENILFNLCETKIKWDWCYWFIPTKKECEHLIEHLGKLIALEPDLPYQFYCARKEAFRILKRLMKEEQ